MHLKGTIELAVFEIFMWYNAKRLISNEEKPIFIHNFNVTAPKGGTCKQVKAFEFSLFLECESLCFLWRHYSFRIATTNHKIWIRLRTRRHFAWIET